MVGACSLRYMQVTAPADLDIINANVQLNGGKVAFEASACSVSSALLTVRSGHHRGTGIQLSFNLKRYCSSGTLTYTSALNGMSFSGSAISAVNYTALNPWYEMIRTRWWAGPGSSQRNSIARPGSFSAPWFLVHSPA